MTSTVIITLVVIGAIVWLAVLGVSALRSRGSEEVPANLAPGETDQAMETRRLERVQQAAVLLSAFLAVGIPLYYLGEPARQESFVEDYAEESVARGLAHYEEYQCASCHGADGGGGAASYVEKRSGVTVSWAAPAINDVFYRYDRDEVRYWLVYGRQNSPMPAWGLDGGGPMNEQQIEELIDYLQSDEFALSQVDTVGQVEGRISASLSGLENAQGSVESQIVDQQQLIADIERASELEPIVADIVARADALTDQLDEGIDTDGDGVSDSAEVAVNQLTAEYRQVLLLPGVEEVSLDPNNAETNGISDLEFARQLVDTYRELADSGRAPILAGYADAIEALIEGEASEGSASTETTDTTMAAETTATTASGDTTETTVAGDTTETTAAGDTTETTAADPATVDTDGDGLTDQAETAIGGQVILAIGAITNDYAPTSLDPSNPETVAGTSDLITAETALNDLETQYTNIRLNDTNQESLLQEANDSLAFLQESLQEEAWSFDFESIADQSFDGDVERAQRVVGIFQAYCARCHTSGYSAGPAFTQVAGSGALGPALYDGRPAVQFLSDEDLKDFLIVGAVPNQPYGVNGMGNGRMPAFGEVLAEEDLLDLAHWLRNGDLTGRGVTGRID